MRTVIWPALAAVMMVTAACGGGGSSTTTPTSPTPPSSTTPPSTTPPPSTPPTDSATITIGTDGRITPSSVTILRGGRVTFVNNHNRAHDMSSDPHPEHTDCPPMSQVGFLSVGQSRTSGNFTIARTCGFHDHNEENNTALQGRIIIQ